MSLLLAMVVDTTVVVATACALVSLMRRQSASLRHAVLAIAILAAAATPLLEIAVPKVMVMRVPRWEPRPRSEFEVADMPGLKPRPARDSDNPLASNTEAGPIAAADSRAFSGVSVFDAATLLVAVWALGVAANLFALLLGLLNLRRLTTACSRVHEGLWRDVTNELERRFGLRRTVAILQSDDPALLVACGVIRPVIVLPAGAQAWTDQRVRIVLAHELAHVRRRDGAMQLAAELLRCVHWFNPLVWLACRRLRQESEYACDDAVLTGGTDASDYAVHLLAVARHARGFERMWAAAPGITHPSTLERRIAAMLRPHQSRLPLTRRTAVVASLAAAVVVIPLAAASIAPGGDQGSGSKSGFHETGTSGTGRDIVLTAAALPDADTAVVQDDLSLTRASRATAPHQAASPAAVTSSDTTSSANLSAGPVPLTPESQARDLQALKDRLAQLRLTKNESHPDVRQAQTAIAQLEQTIAAQGTQGTIVGSVKDATGAVLPGATVRISSADLAVTQQTTTDTTGAFMFRNLQPARYDVAVSLPGFDTISAVLTVPARQTVGRSFALPVGAITENINVSCGSQAGSSPVDNGVLVGAADRSSRELSIAEGVRRVQQLLFATVSAQAAGPVRVGGNIQAPRKLTDARPVCPTVPRADTTVVLVGRIGTDGALRGVRSLRPGNSSNTNDSDATALELLTRSAMDAVSGWTFTPARLNGTTVEVDATIQITFRPSVTREVVF